MPSLLTLPRELQLQIAEYVSEHHITAVAPIARTRIADCDQLVLKLDQKSLCLVCKEIRDVGTQTLYKEMVIHMDKLNDNLRQVIATTEKYRGLPYVRSLRITGRSLGDSMSCSSSKTLSELLSAIPRNILTHFQ
jgi:hypothetical protein